MSKNDIKLVECPRDAIQGISHFIPTDRKVKYINQLILSGLFDFIDFGSFVSPKAVPQMKDTADVIEGLEKNNVKLIAIIANEKGAEIGAEYQKIDYLGYPFSISETFQKRNTNCSINEAFETVKNTKNILENKGSQELIIYISMAFGNPYNDPWNMGIVVNWIEKLHNLGICKFSIADTTSEASPEQINTVFGLLKTTFPELELSIHLHSRAESAAIKIGAAYDAGCRTFEGAMMGYGGCPFAEDELVGNIPSELLIDLYRKEEKEKTDILQNNFQRLIIRDEI